MTTSNRERRDWTLLIFLIPIGIIFMLIAGQFAVRLFPIWSVKAGMQSKLDPDFLSGQQNLPLQPISQAILTPMGWLDTFLTPGAGSGDQIVFPPFVVFEPSATALVTRTPPPTVATTAIPVTASPTAVVPQPTSSNTPKPPVNTPVPPTTATTAVPPTIATTAIPPTIATTAIPPTTATTAIPPTIATTAVPPTIATTAVPPTPGPGASTPVGTQVTTVPPGFTIGGPDGVGSMNLSDGQFYVVDLGSDPNNQVNVNGTSDTGYDLVYYEMLNVAFVYMDRVIIGISQFSNGNFMYTVFNWGDGAPDTNSNLVCSMPSCPEDDNQQVDPATLYGTPPLQTGIAIDVDNAPSAPPIGLYQYIVLQAAGSGGSIDVDAIQVLPDPPLPVSPMSNSPVDEALIPSVDEVPIPPADEVPIPPTDEPPVLPEATP